MFDVHAEFVRRQPEFYHKHPIVSRWVISFGRYLWSEKEFNKFALDHADKKGIELINAGFKYINFDFSVNPSDLVKIPAKGKLIIIANHPLFALDGLGLLKIISQVRKDLKIVVGGTFDAFQDLTIVVDDTKENLTKDVILAMHKHLENEGALIIFPSGQLSRFVNGKIQDPPWHSSFFKLALRKDAPILPVFISAKNTIFYYFLAFVCLPFSRVWVIRQLFFQRNKRPRMIFGDVISPELIDYQFADTHDKVNAIRDIVYSLGRENSK